MKVLQVFWAPRNGSYKCVSSFAAKQRARGWPRAFTCSLCWIASKENIYTYELKRGLYISKKRPTSLKDLLFLEVGERGALFSSFARSVAALGDCRIAVEWFEAWTELSHNNSIQSLERMVLQFCGSWRVAIVGLPRVCTSEPWDGWFGPA